MGIQSFSLEHISEAYEIEQDWLFEKLVWKLSSFQNLILTADQNWGIKDYVNELEFQLAEKNQSFHTCHIDIRPAQSSDSFLELYYSVLSQRFPDPVSHMKIDGSSREILRIPEIIARKLKRKVAVFIANSHYFHRIKDSAAFLRKLKLGLKNQRNCVFCLYGNNHPGFRDLIIAPGPLSGLGQLFELKHNPLKNRSASIRKLFHDHNKKIDYATSLQMSYAVDNIPFYLMLLAWHAFILTHSVCSAAIVEEAMNNLIHHFEYRFYRIMESLTPKQIRGIKALVEGNQQLYSTVSREEYQLGSTGHVARIKSSLEKKEIIQSDRSELRISDPIFREWLQRRYFVREWI